MIFSERHIGQIYTDKKNKSKPLQLKYEDISFAPDSNTIIYLVSIKLGISPELLKLLSTTPTTENVGESQFQWSSQDDVDKEDKQDEPMTDAFDDLNTDHYEDVLRGGELFEPYHAFFYRYQNTYSNIPSINIGDDLVSKDTGKIDWKERSVRERLESKNQQERLKILEVVGYNPVSE